MKNRAWWHSFHPVFSRWQYVLLAAMLALALLVFGLSLQLFSFLSYVLFSSGFPLLGKLEVVTLSIVNAPAGLGTVSFILLLVLALLSGVQLAMTLYYFKRRARIAKTAGLGTGALLIGLVGIGCASCGSILISTILGVGLASSFLTLLPLGGIEFGLVGISLLLISIWIVARKLQEPLVC